jgi:hypothetical protein
MGKESTPWRAIYAAWRAGASLEGLSKRHGMGVNYLRESLNAARRVLGEDMVFAGPGCDDPRLEPALSALARGEAGEAERQAKAVSAVVRAGEALEAQRRRERLEAMSMSDAALEQVLEEIEEYVQARVRSEIAARAAAQSR